MNDTVTTRRLQKSLSSEPNVRIFLLSRLNVYLEGLLSVLHENERFTIAACVEPGRRCLERFTATSCDILLVQQDAVQEPLNRFFSTFKERKPGVGIMVFGSQMDPEYLCKIVRGGAHGYVHDGMGSADLYKAINTIRQGGLWIQQEIFEQFVYGTLEIEQTIEKMIREKIESFRSTLTDKEIMVFQLVLEGLSTKEISERIHLSEQSVKLYLGRLFRKFDVTNRPQLILMAFERICPVSNLIRIFRIALDKRRVQSGKTPFIRDPLEQS